MQKWWLLGVLLISQSALACINAVGTDRNGHRFEPGDFTGDELVAQMTSIRNSEYLDREALRLAEKVRSEPDFANLNDLGVVLIRYGRTTRAIRLFVANERRFPGRAETAANLGTALELAGFDAIALKWIRIGIQRNVAEHEGTEWLHARILEAKIGIRKDPSYLDGRSIAGIRFDSGLVPDLPDHYPQNNARKPVLPYQLNSAFAYQLRERLQFVRPKDKVVANLLTDWATLNLAGGPIENAEALYGLAERYGAPRTALVAARRRHVRRILATRDTGKEPVTGTCTICEPPIPPPAPESFRP